MIVSKLMAKLKQRRIELGYTQAEIANHLNLSQNTISNYENGIREMSLEDIEKLLDFLGLELSLPDRVENELLNRIDFTNSKIDWNSFGIDFFNELWSQKRQFIFPQHLHPTPLDTGETLLNKLSFYNSLVRVGIDLPDPYDQHEKSNTMIYTDFSEGTLAEFGPTFIEINCLQFQSRLEYLYHHHQEITEMFDLGESRITVKAFDMYRGDIPFPVFPLLKDTLTVNKSVSLGFDLFSFKSKYLKE
ncbi:helix-turn-helix domain-containing protein [Priestia koreensis]|uniref:helix-turn-helix domain-containing protein n=1 Tax=Priestia koreensis TaxID=284581 RepID=UPI001F5A5819|nr:helix-turn-helix transcriptional regulator [Priestia koreensis]UNL85279.1 helix-turn-helix transcriptional regulator [Priestia koreensis]